ncbi:hypothetical protein AUJ83_00230 [Candidatus Woesearchaeota archaeon CG1_02_33_12]|nr:MAG: hypothetical protein AUJ83_00230 [Candidatus Woesearchaeota archaeon CG1_02_33_12]PIU72127.1 MAG: hypothetical protein COS79_04580 [Candidatus Woesearchaeota archaeon CG06_land_8_20_14_3_00_33_13]
MAQEEKCFYVGVEEPVSLRKKLLESSKEIIQGLKDYEELKLIREERHKKIIEFKEKIDEILSLASWLKEQLPKQELKEQLSIKSRKRGTQKEMIKRSEIKTDELLRLENELSDVESRLGRM